MVVKYSPRELSVMHIDFPSHEINPERNKREGTRFVISHPLIIKGAPVISEEKVARHIAWLKQ